MSDSIDSTSLTLSCISDLSSQDAKEEQQVEEDGLILSGYVAEDEASLESSVGGASWSCETVTEEDTIEKEDGSASTQIQEDDFRLSVQPVVAIVDGNEETDEESSESGESSEEEGEEEQILEQEGIENQERQPPFPSKNLKRKRVTALSPGREPEDLV